MRSLQGLTYSEDAVVDRDTRELIEHGADWVMFTTGIGYELLHKSAQRLGLVPAFVDTLKKAKVVSRGYRTYAFLKNIGITPAVHADDGTTLNITHKLDHTDFTGQRVWIQLHGEPSCELSEYMETRGAAEIVTSLPYHYQPPERETLDVIINELKEGSVDAVQVQYLFDYARETGCENEVRDAFERKVLAVAVGKVTAESLREAGIGRVIVPELERMGSMIVEISSYYESLAV